MRRGIAALRDFDPADDRFGSFTADQDTPDFACMSALPPIATKLVRRNEVTLCANYRQSRHIEARMIAGRYT